MSRSQRDHEILKMAFISWEKKKEEDRNKFFLIHYVHYVAVNDDGEIN